MNGNTSAIQRPGRFALIVALAVALVAGLALASAMVLAQLGTSNFEIEDGNTIQDGADPALDWDTPSIASDVIVVGDLPSGSGDDSFGQGSKEDTEVPAVVDGSIPPNKSDLLQFGVYQEGTGGSGYLHLFWTRVQDPSGTTLMDFEINKEKCEAGDPDSMCSANGVTPVRTSLDMLITYELAKGGKIPDLYLYRWLDGSEGATADDCKAANSLPCWGYEIDLDQANLAAGSINDPDAITSSLLGATYDPRTFGEASIDLSVIFDNTACESFGSAYLKSRSSDSFPAALKDFIAPEPINLGNCGSITVNKIVDPSTSAETFDFSVAGPTSYGFSLGHGESDTNNEVVQGDYTITETDANSGGYDLVDVTCYQNTVEFPVVGDVPAFNLGIGDEVECTFTNQARGTIIVEKKTVGDIGTFSFTSSTLSPFDLTTTAEGEAGKDSETFADLVPGTYDVSETDPGAAWDLTSATCDDGSDPGSIDLGAGETVTCTFENTKRGSIKIIKQTNPSGLTDSFDFTDDIPASGSFSLLGNGGFVEFSNLAPNMAYHVTESDPASAGFRLDDITCVDSVGGGTASSGDTATAQATINLDPGESVECTFTNSTGAVKVTKTAKNASMAGGSAPLAGVTFQLKQGGAVLESQVTAGEGIVCFDRLVPGESYDILEASAPAGYSLDANNPRSIAIAAGATCSEGGTPQEEAFENIPLSQIEVIFTSLAGDGVTVASITCELNGEVVDPVGGDATPSDLDDGAETITDLEPGIYTCTVNVDP